jgi:serine protease Do
MYDNNYPNKDAATQDNSSVQEQSAAVQDQTSQGGSAQNQQTTPQYQNRYSGYGDNQYYRNTYSGSNYGQNTAHGPYGNQQSGYYTSAGSTNGNTAAGTSNTMNRPGGANGSGTAYGRESYQYGNTYPNYTQMDTGKHKKKKEKKPHSGGFLKKALVCVSLGLLFGLFAGAGLYIVQAATGVIGSAVTTVESTEETVQATAGSDAQGGAAATAGGTEADSGIRTTDSITTIVADVSEVVKEVMPAIVSINNHYTEKMSYFGQTMTSEADASGSGIIVGQNDTELLIVSNYHVIENADELTVQFTEGSEAKASIKGTDPDMDLAVIAVPVSDVDNAALQEIAVATLGDSDSLTVGEPAIAIGNSLGYGQSVTTGVISALNRNIQLSDGTDGTFIQTDAAINPGNSGGALLNMKGEVVGINSNKIGGSAVEGMGYAIPISAASPIIAELMLKETKNKVAEEERGYLGISGISVTQEVSEAYGMPEGVYISQVYENTAAAAAGLRKGDIIVEFDGDKISSMDALQRELEFYAQGDTVDVTVMTPGAGGYESRTVQLTLGNRS